MANRLRFEKSPYLLQHASNPVDWYPWGEDAFEKARREDKPILLSVGYSTCHWCHVMERESFENASIAALMNRDFVCIKLDREERPEIDKIYMTAVGAMTGQGGWPLNVFLTPRLKPFYGGTYFPPEPRWGRPSWPQLLEQIAAAWKNRREEIERSGEELGRSLGRFLESGSPAEPVESVDFSRAVEEFESSFDSELGGFGGAPKFPMPVNQDFLLRAHARLGGGPALEMALKTLRAMSKGGIYDQLGGGFHRYSTDERWHVPHFEKMLYDNALLAVNYLEAFQITGEPGFASTARGILEYALRELTHPEGGFYSAEDADSPVAGKRERAEGAFYVWEKREILEALGAEAGERFCRRYGVAAGGNAAFDPHGEFAGKNILFLAEEGPSDERLREAARALFEIRSKRPRPHLDDKVLVSWNGLMISAMAKGGSVLGESRYTQAARRAAAFIRERLYEPGARRLLRRWRDGEAKFEATGDDYAFLTQGLLDLYESSFECDWLEWAVALNEEQVDGFYDSAEGGFFMTRAGTEGSDLLYRVKEAQDNVEPSASSVAVSNLLRLSRFTGREAHREMAAKTLAHFSGQMKRSPRTSARMLAAADFFLSKPVEIVIAGDPRSPKTQALLSRVRRRFLPHAVVVLLSEGERGRLERWMPFLASMRPKAETAYVCFDYACRAPVEDPDGLEELLEEVSKPGSRGPR